MSKTQWIKPGTRVEPQNYVWLKQFADKNFLSINDALNLLLREAIKNREEGNR